MKSKTSDIELRRPHRKWIALTLMCVGIALAFRSPDVDSVRPSEIPSMASYADASLHGTPRDTTTKSIESVRVGDRVIAANPELTATDRSGRTEPNWDRWLRLEADMLTLNDDGSAHKRAEIDLLRSERWALEQLCLLVEFDTGDDGRRRALIPIAEFVDGSSLCLLRPFYQSLSTSHSILNGERSTILALLAIMDIPELGLSGPAFIKKVSPAPPVADCDGQVVTATFRHTSSAVLDLILKSEDGKCESIGTTSNHPFWCVDDRKFVQAELLEIGDRVRTFHGDTKRVVSKLPRPGPEPVHNLEVHGEHTYFVGSDGVLVHNGTGHGSPYSQIITDLAPDERRMYEMLEIRARRALETGSVDPDGVVLGWRIRSPADDAVPLAGTRGTGVNRGYRAEEELIRLTGRGTRPYEVDVIEYIRNGGRFDDDVSILRRVSSKGTDLPLFTGHHGRPVAAAEIWEGDPRNIYIMMQGKGKSHMVIGHPLGTRNAAKEPFMPLIDRQLMIEEFNLGILEVDIGGYGKYFMDFH